jgi:hypothetical protein
MFLQSIAASILICWIAPGQTVSVDTTVAVQDSILLHDAVRQGKVRVEVKSRGGATGPTIRVEVQRLVPGDLRIEVAPGTVLLNSQSAEQNVTVGQLKGEFTGENKYRPGQVMVLADTQRHAFLLEVYCLDYAKKAPRKGGKLELALQDKRVARILNPPEGVQPSLGAVQIAIWMDRAGITADQARKRFRGTTTEVDVQVARQLLVHAEQTGVASIPQDMPASVRVHVSKLFSADPAIRQRAAAALGKLGAEAMPAVPFLVENLLDLSTDKPLPASVVRVDVDAAIETAADTLDRLGLPGLAPIIDSLRKAGGATGQGAATAGEDGANATSDPVEESLRMAGGLVTEAIVDLAIGRLANDKASVRERAARSLGAAGSQRAVEPLIKLLEDDNEQVRTAAADALQKLTNQSFGTDVNPWREWFKTRGN